MQPPPVSDLEPISFSQQGDRATVDEGDAFCPKFDADGLLPALAIDAATKEPLMLAWMNEESLKQTLRLGEAVYYSRSRKEIWHKGATSGHTQILKEIRTDCDQDVLLLYVDQQGAGACHTGRRSCFYRQIVPGDPTTLKFVDDERTFDPKAVYGKSEGTWEHSGVNRGETVIPQGGPRDPVGPDLRKGSPSLPDRAG